MEDAESGLREFERTQDRSDKGRSLARQLTAAAAQSRNIEQTIAVDEQKIRIDQEQMKVNPQQPAPQQDSSPNKLLLQNLRARLQAAETKRAQFLQKYAPNYALVQDADKEVSEAKAAIAAVQSGSQRKQTPARLPDLAFIRERLVARPSGSGSATGQSQRHSSGSGGDEGANAQIREQLGKGC